MQTAPHYDVSRGIISLFLRNWFFRGDRPTFHNDLSSLLPLPTSRDPMYQYTLAIDAP
jgi:hypothetical protein